MQLRERAAAAASAAALAATEEETAHVDYVAAQQALDEARRTLDAVTREVAEVAAQVSALERHSAGADTGLQAETSHAAFTAYRRGDITAEQLREVFRRAEGWTPEHDRLSRRTTQLRAQEAEATKHRDAAEAADHLAGERARAAARSARTLDDEARMAAADARARCAAADACEQRGRRR